MATTSFIGPSIQANDTSIGTDPWDVSGAGAAFTVNSSFVTCADTVLDGVTPSNYLVLTGYDFTGAGVDIAATILGIQATITRKADGNSTHTFVKDSTLKLVIAGTPSGTNKAVTGTKWPTASTALTYGATNDLWGLTPTAAQVRASNFGIALSIVAGDGGGLASVDCITLAITYTPGTEAEEVQIANARVMMSQP